jgi:hypothetical protein
MSAGKILGPYSLDEIRNLLAGGMLDASEMIGVETWLPVATLSGMLLSGPPKAGATAGAAAQAGAGQGEGETEDEELEEIEVQEVDDEAADGNANGHAAANDDEGKIAMDAEFNID